jgi:hypothetical protein
MYDQTFKHGIVQMIDQYLTLINPARTFLERLALFFQTWEWHSGAARKRAQVLRENIVNSTEDDQIFLHVFKYAKGTLKDLLQFQIVKHIRISKKNMDILQNKIVQSYMKFSFWGRRRSVRKYVDKLLADHKRKLQESSSVKPIFRR